MQVYLVLLEGRNGADPLFLQIKQAGPSVYEQFPGASPHPGHGQRVISGKRVIQVRPRPRTRTHRDAMAIASYVGS